MEEGDNLEWHPGHILFPVKVIFFFVIIFCRGYSKEGGNTDLTLTSHLRIHQD